MALSIDTDIFVHSTRCLEKDRYRKTDRCVIYTCIGSDRSSRKEHLLTKMYRLI